MRRVWAGTIPGSVLNDPKRPCVFVPQLPGCRSRNAPISRRIESCPAFTGRFPANSGPPSRNQSTASALDVLTGASFGRPVTHLTLAFELLATAVRLFSLHR